jgi:hypothetical protein
MPAPDDESPLFCRSNSEGEGGLEQIEIALPREIADELVADGLGWRVMRGRDWVAAATLAVDAVSTFVVLTINRADLMRAVRRVTGHARRDAGGGARIEVHITVGDVSRVESESNDRSGSERLEIRIVALLEGSESGDDDAPEP